MLFVCLSSPAARRGDPVGRDDGEDEQSHPPRLLHPRALRPTPLRQPHTQHRQASRRTFLRLRMTYWLKHGCGSAFIADTGTDPVVFLNADPDSV